MTEHALTQILEANERMKAAYNQYAKLTGRRILVDGKLVLYSDSTGGLPRLHKEPTQGFKTLAEENQWLLAQCNRFNLDISGRDNDKL